MHGELTLSRIAGAALLAWCSAVVGAEPPEIGDANQGAPNYSPILILGEGFETKSVDFFALSPKVAMSPAEMIGCIDRADVRPPDEPPKARFKPGLHEGLFAIVFNGRGMGQYRRVLKNTDTRMVLDAPWRIVPDGSSWIVVRRHTAMRTGSLYVMTHSEPAVLYNRFESCQLYESPLLLWNLHLYDHHYHAASLLGSVFWRNVLPMDLVVDRGTRSVWADNTDAMKLHLKDAMDFELPRRK